ncbi:hypothetical protein [Roseomonas gilardii]|uniref:hypothetical protein n=1 Tax=Roseomonas gilardii TaxID=257708 RepID=UPI0011A79448|nr:hypothetical protein [Roseomonas gilardii]
MATPKNAIALLKHEIEFNGYSPPMREAFEDFRVRFQRGERLLAQHRFWRLLDDVRASLERTLDRKDRTLQSSLTLTIGIDEADIELDFVVGTDAELLNGSSAMRRVSGPPGAVLRQVIQIAADLAAVLQDIGKAASAGLMLFEQQTWGTWRFVGASAVRTEAVALIRADHIGRVNRLGITCRPISDSWSISKVLSLANVEELVRALLRLPTFAGDDELASVAVIDAVRTGAAMLGRPGTLPRIRVTASAEVRLIPAHEARGSLGVEPDRSVLGQNGTWRFTAKAPVGGSWRLLAQEGESTDTDEAELLLRFDERALEHLELTDPEQSPTRLEHEAEMLASQSGTLHVRRRLTEDESIANPRLDDLLEAIYAGGRSGWSEADLIPLIRRVLPFESAPKVFDVIHLLQAAGWIEPRLLTQWRGRRWFLRRPRLVAVRQDDEIALVLDGSTPEVVRERFHSIVAQQGGRVEVRPACGDWGPPMLVAQVDDPFNVGSTLGFEVEEAAGIHANPAPACWSVETRSLTNRVLASSWCWQSGSFKTNPEPIPTAVKLERHIRSRGDDRDVYSVASGDKTAILFTSRTIAILEAYRQAGKSLFQKEQEYLVRSTQDGYLPLSAIRWLRFLHLANPGVLHVAGQRHTLAYPIDDVSLPTLSRWFGSAVAGTSSKRPDRRLSVGIARHRAHRPRLVWRDSLHDERSDRVENP